MSKETTRFYDGTTVPRRAVVLHNKYLGIANEGFFASTAWLESDERFSEIAGTGFGFFDAFDTGMTYKEDKYHIRQLKQSEWDLLPDEVKEYILDFKESNNFGGADKYFGEEFDFVVHLTRMPIYLKDDVLYLPTDKLVQHNYELGRVGEQTWQQFDDKLSECLYSHTEMKEMKAIAITNTDFFERLKTSVK